MRTLVAVSIIALTTASCIVFDHRSSGDDTPTVGSTCQRMTDEFEQAIAQRGTCNVDSDCVVIGGQDGAATCDCAPHLGNCSGSVIAKNAPNLARARQLEWDYWLADGCGRTACSTGDGSCTCDCAPITGVACSNHTCVGTTDYTCFGIPGDAHYPDAAVSDAAVYPDAYVLDAP